MPKRPPPPEPPQTPPPESDPKVAGHIDPASAEKAKAEGKRKAGSRFAQLLEGEERELIKAYVRGRLAALGDTAIALGLRPGFVVKDDGEIVVRSLPREVRQFAREAIMVVGIPRLAAIAACGTDYDATGAINVLRQMGVSTSISTMDADGQEDQVPAVVLMPQIVPLVPPDGPVAIVEAPKAANGNGRKQAIERVKKLLPPKRP